MNSRQSWCLFFLFILTPIGVAFTQPTSERPIAVRYSHVIQGILSPHDSSCFFFSGARGGYLYKGPSQNVDKLLFDNEINLRFDSAKWKTISNVTQTFDPNNRLLSFISNFFDGINWINRYKEIHDYSSNHNLEDTLSIYNADSTGWYGNNRTVRIFNNLGNVQTEVSLIWSNTLRDWVNKERKEYLYDSLFRVVSINGFIWDTTRWKLGGRDSFVLDAKGNRILYLDDNIYNNSWQHINLESQSFDSLNRVVTHSYQQYDPQAGAYIEWKRYGYTYIANNGGSQELYYTNYPNIKGFVRLSSKIIRLNDKYGREILDSGMFIDSSGKWNNGERIQTTRDAIGNILILKDENWGGGVWGGSMNICTYDMQNQVTNVKSFKLDSGISTLVEDVTIWYEGYSDVKSPMIENFSSQVYPNPFTGSFSVEFTSKNQGQATLLLFDVNGKLITRTTTNAFVGKNTIVWDTGRSLHRGFYNYELLLDGKISFGKILSQ